jgi:excisionase family DNA binding protein
MTQPQHTDHASAEGEHATEPPVARLAYSIKEAAEATGLSRDLLYDEMRAGRLAYLKIGRRRIITRQQLQAFLNRGVA